MSDGDHDAIAARREILLRRALLAGAASALGAACAPRPCLSAPYEPVCGGRDGVTLPNSAHWTGGEEPGRLQPKTILFATDKAVPDKTGIMTFDPQSAEVNQLSPAGIAAFEELVPHLGGMEVRVTVSIGGGTNAPGKGADGALRAETISAFLLTKGITANAAGAGRALSGEFNQYVKVTACAPAPKPGAAGAEPR